jgi:WD40 repeat protein
MRNYAMINVMLTIFCLFVSCLPATAENPNSTQLPKAHLVLQEGHPGRIISLALSKDAKKLVTGGSNGTLKLWDVFSGKELRSFLGHIESVWSVSISPNREQFVSAGGDGTVRLWDMASGQELQRFVGHNGIVSSVCFLDSNRIATGGWDGTVRIWELSTGKEFKNLRMHTNKVTSISSNGDGKAIISASYNGSVKIWNADTGAMTREFSLSSLASDANQVNSIRASYSINALSVSADGKYAAMIIHGYNHYLRKDEAIFEFVLVVWDFQSGKLQRVSNYYAGLSNLAFLPDNKTVIAGNGKDIVFFDCSNGQVTRRIVGHKDLVRAVAVSTDGSQVASGSDNQDHTAKLWETTTGKLLQEFKREFGREGQGAGADFVSFIGDGSVAVTGSHPWHLYDSINTPWLESFSDVVSVTSHGRFVFNRTWNNRIENQITQWDILTKQPLCTMDGLSFHNGDISQDGKYRVDTCESFEGHISIKEACTDRIISILHGKLEGLHSFAFSSDGNRIIGGGWTSDVMKDNVNVILNVWDVKTGILQHKLNGHREKITAIAASPTDNVAASGSADGTVIVWSLKDGKLLCTLDGKQGSVQAVAFSPDGSLIASAGDDKKIIIWELSPNKQKFIQKTIIDGINSSVSSLAISPDKKLLLSGNASEPAILWDVKNGKELCRLAYIDDEHHTWLVFDPDGRFDTNNLEGIKGLLWIISNDPFSPLPIEAFMREYYEPRLLQRILGGDTLNNVFPLSGLNTVQPEVKIIQTEPVPHEPDRIIVTVKVRNVEQTRQRNDATISLQSGAENLRLFRDGHLVGYVDGPLAFGNDKSITVPFPVKLPAADSSREKVTLTAYAFNSSRIKSTTDLLKIPLPELPTPPIRRAYIIVIGSDASDLSFASEDARLLGKVLSSRLKQNGEFEAIQVNLITSRNNPDGHNERNARPEYLKAVLDILRGREVPNEIQELIPGITGLKPATPNDIIIISFSGHGYTDNQGVFSFLTDKDGESLSDSTISSDMLSKWLRDIDAGECAIIIDACYAAASFQENGYKPGPMGSRGLGQLAYDKGMKILAATQADDTAIESGALRHGLLTFALVSDGLDHWNADYRPKDGSIGLKEWLSYGVYRVPGLHSEIQNGAFDNKGKGAKLSLKGNLSFEAYVKRLDFQQPVLFDFTGRETNLFRVGK